MPQCHQCGILMQAEGVCSSCWEEFHPRRDPSFYSERETRFRPTSQPTSYSERELQILKSGAALKFDATKTIRFKMVKNRPPPPEPRSRFEREDVL
jgi:hypothetical protein